MLPSGTGVSPVLEKLDRRDAGPTGKRSFSTEHLAVLFPFSSLMKLKQRPEDFQVEELTDRVPADAGCHALYRLEKSGWSTPDALAVVQRRLRIDRGRFSFGGLKDRHARTVQYLTIHHGPPRNLKHQAIALRYLGQTAEPYTSKDIRANRFRLTLRSLNADDLPAMEQALDEVRRQGVPNYFDDQRFGSVGSSGKFIAREMVFGRFEEALRLALLSPYEHDRAAQKKEKAILRSCWGDWSACQSRLLPGHARDLATYLGRNPGDYRGAVVRLRPELRGLYLSVYQSWLWNRMVALWMQRHFQPEQLRAVPLVLGEVPMHRSLGSEKWDLLRSLQLPLPSARQHLDPADPRAELASTILTEEGLEMHQLQVKGVRELFFSKGDRAALSLPFAMEWTFAPDELNQGMQKLTLAFELARGSYATLIVKRVHAAPGR